MSDTNVRPKRRHFRYTIGFCLLALISSSRSAFADDSAPEQVKVGVVTGRLVFEGEIPKPRILVQRGSAQKDAKVCAAQANILDESLQVDEKSRGIANAIIWMIRKPSGLKLQPPPKLAKADQPAFDRCRIVPRSAVFRTDQEIKVWGDSVVHNPHTFSIRNPHP